MDLSGLSNEELQYRLTLALQKLEKLEFKSITKNEDYNQPIYTKDFLEHIINQVAEPVFVKNEQHKWVLLNDAYCEFMGYERRQLIARTDHDFFPKEQADIFWQKDDEVLSTGIINVNKETFTDSAGKVHVIVTKKKLFEDQIGSKFIVGVIHDITGNSSE